MCELPAYLIPGVEPGVQRTGEVVPEKKLWGPCSHKRYRASALSGHTCAKCKCEHGVLGPDWRHNCKCRACNSEGIHKWLTMEKGLSLVF